MKARRRILRAMMAVERRGPTESVMRELHLATVAYDADLLHAIGVAGARFLRRHGDCPPDDCRFTRLGCRPHGESVDYENAVESWLCLEVT